ncbi:MAG: DUF2155 domain-containing protein [Alphaproteobacteria bacterium]|nr:DUF2155 domain-containing protein [Alphaproteobacteria bacterium]
MGRVNSPVRLQKFPARQRNVLWLAALGIALAGPGFAETIGEPVALLQGLDKITARVSKFEAPVGTPVRFGNLSIRVRDCEKNPPEDPPESAAFLEIDELHPGEASLRVFSGWMFASSPALSALEHPIYDVNVLDCRTESGSPPASSGKVEEKTAR